MRKALFLKYFFNLLIIQTKYVLPTVRQGILCTPIWGPHGLRELAQPPHSIWHPWAPCPSPPDAAMHKAALSASSSSFPPVWLLSLPGTHPISLCSTRTLLLYLSLWRESKSPCCPFAARGGSPGCAPVQR